MKETPMAESDYNPESESYDQADAGEQTESPYHTESSLNQTPTRVILTNRALPQPAELPAGHKVEPVDVDFEALARQQEQLVAAQRAQQAHIASSANPVAIAHHRIVEAMPPPVAPTFTYPAIERLLFARERSGFTPFDGNDSVIITNQINELANRGTINDDQSAELQYLAFSRIALHNGMVSRRKAGSEDNAGNRAEYTKEMQSYQLAVELFTDHNRVRNVPGVAQARNYISTKPDFFANPVLRDPATNKPVLIDPATGRTTLDRKIGQAVPKYNLKAFLAGFALTPQQIDVAANLGQKILYFEKSDPQKNIQRTTVMAEELGEKKFRRVPMAVQMPKIEAAGQIGKALGSVGQSFLDSFKL